ncbi:hypothetical protein PI126_g23874 [Phytophthora idaei]|nr:hypothetical protein PI126_g23874 [Phytophthora idaei]
MVKLFCAIVGVAGSAFEVDIDEGQKLFLAKTADGAWLKSKDLLRMRKGEIPNEVESRYMNEELDDPTDKISTILPSEIPEGSIHVLVVVPEGAIGSALSQQVNSVAHQYVVWYGTRGSIVRGEGIDLEDPRTLSRATLTADIIRRLEETHVLLVKSPPMTGKTSLATLVSRSLVDRHTMDNKKMVLFNFSALAIPDDSTFEQVFKKRCTIDWSEATLNLPAPDRMVYLVVDEVQVIYKEGTNSPRRKSTGFWELVKYVLSNGNYSVRILMFAAYGSGVEYTRLATPIQFDDRIVLGIDQLNFSHAEVSEYVQKWFKGITCFEGSSSSAMEEFCANLEEECESSTIASRVDPHAAKWVTVSSQR